MNALSSGTEDIIAESGQTIGAVATLVVDVPSPSYTSLTGVDYYSFNNKFYFVIIDNYIFKLKLK